MRTKEAGSALAIACALCVAACSGRDDRQDTASTRQASSTGAPSGGSGAIDTPTDGIPSPTAGMAWYYKPGMALFGPPESEGVLTMRCEDASLLIARSPGVEERPAASRELQFGTEDEIVAVDMSTADSELGGYRWEGRPDATSRATLATIFDGAPAPVTVELAGDNTLNLPADKRVGEFIRGCR